MGRSHATPIKQPDENSCGPSSLKVALHMLGKTVALKTLITLCQTNSNGTSTKHIIEAANKLGYHVLMVEHATLRHLVAAAHHPHSQPRAVLVNYLYDLNDDNRDPHPDSGHWAAVAGYSASKKRIYLLDSYTKQKKSYAWSDFRLRWKDYDMERKQVGKTYKLVKHWRQQLMLVITEDLSYLPKFGIPHRVFAAK